MQAEASQVGKVLGTSSAGFDSKMIMMPVVRRYVSEEGENWRMWYNGRDSEFDPSVVDMATGRIGSAPLPGCAARPPFASPC